MNCPREGSLSLLVQIPAGQIMDGRDDDPWEPVLVHLTVCKAHLRGARTWLKTRTTEQPISCSTDYLMREWGQIVDPIDLPVFGMSDVRAMTG